MSHKFRCQLSLEHVRGGRSELLAGALAQCSQGSAAGHFAVEKAATAAEHARSDDVAFPE